MSEVPPPASAECVIVLGGGIAGISAAATLQAAGHKVIVIDQQAQIGGTHRSRQIGPYTFDAGSIFYEETASIFDLAPALRESCPEVLSIQRRIAPDGSILLYPIEPRDLLRQPVLRLVLAVLDLIVSRICLRQDGTLEKLCTKRLGRRFFDDTGLRHYLTRFHHVPPRQIDEEFFFRRMAIIERFTRTKNLARSALRAVLPRRPQASARQWPMRVRPQQGFDALFGPIARHLSAMGVEFALSESIVSLAREGAFFRVRTDHGTRLASAIVSTIPLDRLHRALFSRPSGLESLDMTTLYVSAEWLHPDIGNVLFNFHADGAWKRATIYSRIYPDPAIPREFFSVETTLPPDTQHDPQRAFAAFCIHVESLKLARGLKLEGHELLEDCYPLLSVGTRKTLDSVLARIGKTGVITAGRQGSFEYLPTSSGVIAQVARQISGLAAAAPKPEMAA